MNDVPLIDVAFDQFPLCITENRHIPGKKLPTHFHRCKEILYIIDGSGELIINEHRYPIKRFDLIMLDENEQHHIIDDERNLINLYNIYYTPELWNGAEARALFNFLPLPYENRVLSTIENPMLANTASLIRDILYESKNSTPEYAFLARARLTELIVNIRRHIRSRSAGKTQSEKYTPTEHKVLMLARHMETYYYQNFAIEKMASMVPLGKRQFSRIFKKVTQVNFKEYLNRVRIDKAKQMLRIRKDIASVCFETGFKDISYFYKIFKKEAGMTPKEYITRA